MPKPSRNEIYEAVIRKMVTQALEEQEAIFEQEHGQDTDQALLGYIQSCAIELGYSPRFKEIIGWRMIDQHFGSWNEALQKANLIPAVRCPVTKLPWILEEIEKQKDLYRQEKAEMKRKNKQRMEAQAREKKENEKGWSVFLPSARTCYRKTVIQFLTRLWRYKMVMKPFYQELV